MKPNFSKKVAILLMLAVLSTCRKEKEDLSNCEDLHKQPFDVVQKYVEGKWKWIESQTSHAIWWPTNTDVYITKDRVVISGDDGYANDFSYSWKKHEYYPQSMSHVLWNNDQNRGMWTFFELKNDTLFLFSYSRYSGDANIFYYTWLRIK